MTSRSEVLHPIDEGVAGGPAAWSRRHGVILGSLVGLATATQLRSAGAAGPFEVLVVLYSGALLIRARSRFSTWRFLTGRLLGWVVVAGALGGLVSVMAGWSSPSKVLIGLLPYVFALIGMEVVAQDGDHRVFLRWWLLCHGTVVLGSQLLLYFWYLSGSDSLGPIELFIGDRDRKVRFLGWTNNPNQLAMVTTLAATSVVAASRSRMVRLATVAVVFVLGVATGSDGARVALLAGVMLVALALVSGRRTAPWLRIGLLAVALAAASVVAANWASISDSLVQTAEDGNQADERLALWASCGPSIAQSPLVGLGPGSHGELHGQPRSCHNTYIEAATFAGAPMVLFLVWVFAVLAFRQVRRGELLVLFFFGQAAAQMTFSFFFRYPQLWMVLLALEVGVLASSVDEAEANRASGAEGRLLRGRLIGDTRV